ncbi:MAG: aminomethyl-transferring glycine dehydrogenase subunit GcvPA [Mariprofundales bacterium]|nr:aminomethyl-transferring glycine dehydrogenase subunit GcvPA [Mariprofundales bacterium]
MRFLPYSDQDRADMLAQIGVERVRDLFADIPQQLQIEPGSLNLPASLSETDIRRKFQQAAAANNCTLTHRYFLGGGTYHHYIPAAIDYILSRGELLTAYTPYQPEISQGTLQALFEFQTVVARLTGMEIANASMYDAATAVAEAALMAKRVTRRSRIVMAQSINPHYHQVCSNYLSRLNGETVSIPCSDYSTDIPALIAALNDKTAAVIVQNPDFYGALHDLQPLREACDRHNTLLIIAFSDASCFALLDPPGAMGADIAVGSGQSLGIPMAYGGPHIGLFACKKRYLRQMPGRICGLTADSRGKRGFVLTLSTREQHIRRARATSNICSNQGLMCLAVTLYCTLLGDSGMQQVASRSANALQQLISQLPEGVTAASGVHFHETVLRFPNNQTRDSLLTTAEKRGIFAGIPLERLQPGADPATLLVTTTEMVESADISSLIQLIQQAVNTPEPPL